MSLFQQIIGQDRAVRTLRNSLREHRLSHAYLFSGPPGTGKRRTALVLAQAIYCTEREDDACGQCAECRKVQHGNHPDLQIIEPEGQSIKIDQIRNLQRDFSYRTSGGKPKVTLIVHADRMTVEAANSLLKFLEEPSDAAVAILISDNGHAVLPTLQSRSLRIEFVPMPRDRLCEALQREGVAEELARPAAHLASGLDGAQHFIQLNWFAEIRNVVIKLMKDCATPAEASIAVQQDVMKGELAEHVDTLLDLLVLWFKDMIHIQSGRRDRTVFVDQVEWLAKHAYTREPSAWIACMELALEARKRVRANVNAQLALEQLFDRIHGQRP